MASIAPGQVARLHLDSLYRLDGRGRIVEIREPDPPPPPRFVIFRGPDGVVPLVGAALPKLLADRLLALAATEPARDDAPPAHLSRYRVLLAAHQEIEREYAGPAFYLSDTSRPVDGAVRIDAGNRHLLMRHFPEEARDFERRSPIYAAVEEDVAVAVCFAARDFGPGTPAGVFTVETHRGRGHAHRIVGAWAAEVARLGSIPLYGTTWDNAASQAIAARLGAVKIGSDFWIR